MTAAMLIDNDVIIKLAAFKLGSQLEIAIARIDVQPATMLGVGKFVVRDRLVRADWLTDRASVLAALEDFLTILAFVEPTNAELETAAEFERTALQLNLELDGGESQLLAILLNRNYKVLLTGDKRAILAIASIAPNQAQGKLACFEQILLDIAIRANIDDVRTNVCREPKVDRAAYVSFSCFSSSKTDLATIAIGLESYIRDIKNKANDILLKSADLSALAS